MSLASLLGQRPVVVAVAGPNGAGKTTFYNSHLESIGLHLVNADFLVRQLRIGPYEAAKVADSIRRDLIEQGESFVFETVFSDPVGDKIAFLKQASQAGYTVVMCFIGNSGAAISDDRVAIRVSQGGHDVPKHKIIERYPGVMANLKSALRELPHVWGFDNEDTNRTFRLVAIAENGRLTRLEAPTPVWLRPLLPSR
jgi:predicted ABC-type ATPase